MSVDAHGELPLITPRRTRIGLVAGGLGAYWPQFPELLPQLQASARRVSERFADLDCEVVDVASSPIPRRARSRRRSCAWRTAT